jgi:propanediol dehydratase small subunit
VAVSALDGLAYPLADSGRDAVRTASGRPVTELTLERTVAGDVVGDDVRIAPETLVAQARFADEGGNPQLAENLRRGAELVAFSDEELLAFYDRLRPGRSTGAELEELAERLEARGAPLCAALVREARSAYARRGLVA